MRAGSTSRQPVAATSYPLAAQRTSSGRTSRESPCVQPQLGLARTSHRRRPALTPILGSRLAQALLTPLTPPFLCSPS